MAKVYGNGITNLSIGGKQHSSPESVFDVPEECVDELVAAHGMSRTPPVVEAVEAPPAPAKGRRR